MLLATGSVAWSLVDQPSPTVSGADLRRGEL
jgi:hypothetical protein